MLLRWFSYSTGFYNYDLCIKSSDLMSTDIAKKGVKDPNWYQPCVWCRKDASLIKSGRVIRLMTINTIQGISCHDPLVIYFRAWADSRSTQIPLISAHPSSGSNMPPWWSMLTLTGTDTAPFAFTSRDLDVIISREVSVSIRGSYGVYNLRVIVLLNHRLLRRFSCGW